MKGRQGFTLIEILIVVAIIAILASVVLVGLGPTQQSGRDAKRLGDLHNVQTGLELYFNRCGFYPGPAQAAGACAGYSAQNSWILMSAALTGTAGLGIRTIPIEPTAGKSYWYGATAGGTSYILAAQLENANNSVWNSYTAPSSTGYVFGSTSPAWPGTCASPVFCLTL